MDLLLAHGYFLAEDAHELQVMKPYPPLGILYITAYLKSCGFDVEVFDSTFQTMADFDKTLDARRPAIIGLYCNLMTKFNVLTMIQKAKLTGALVVLGGPEPPYYAEEYLQSGADVIVIGEGEHALEELIPALAKGGPNVLHHIAGIAFRDSEGKTVKTAPRPMIPELDSLPPPDRTAIDLNTYIDSWREHHGMGMVSLITARGCPYKCNWCSHSVYGHTHRRHSPQRVASEVEHLIETYTPDQLWYADDVFTIKHSWFFEYAAELKQRNIHVPFECISRADRMNDKIVETLAEMGCFRLWIGSESGSQRILDGMERGVQVERVQEMTHKLQRQGIEVGMFIMLGYEDEEEQDIAATIAHLKESNPDIFLTTVAYPIRGTKYYERVSNRIVARNGWEARTDRDLSVAGRHSRRYYEAAIRWMVGSVDLHKRWHNGPRQPRQLMRAAANIARGRLTMSLSRNEVERLPL